MARHMGQVGVWPEDSLEDSQTDKHAVWKEWAHGVVINGCDTSNGALGSCGGGGVARQMEHSKGGIMEKGGAAGGSCWEGAWVVVALVGDGMG